MEHAGWVAFIDLFLVLSCWWGDRELIRAAERETELEFARATVEERIRERTAELWQTEERFRRAFDDAATGMALVAPEGRFLRVNKASAPSSATRKPNYWRTRSKTSLTPTISRPTSRRWGAR